MVRYTHTICIGYFETEGHFAPFTFLIHDILARSAATARIIKKNIYISRYIDE